MHSHIMTLGCRALRVSCLIGIYPHERVTPQELVIDCSALLQLDFKEWQDAIDSTMSYMCLVEVITKTLKEGCFQVLETAAYTLVQTLLALDPRILEVSIRIEKQIWPENVIAFVALTQKKRALT